jgi:uncharacterized membrane protein
LFGVLLIGYPVACHVGIVSGYPVVAALWLWGLLSYLALTLPRGRWLYGIPIAIGALVSLSGPVDLGALMVRVQPVVITGMLALMFGRSLMSDRTPLIVRIGEYLKGDLPPQVASYGRRLTVFWTLLLAFLALESALLGLFGTPFWWSLFTNLINYLIILLVFVVEYPIRRRVLSEVEHESFFNYVASLAHIGFFRMR